MVFTLIAFPTEGDQLISNQQKRSIVSNKFIDFTRNYSEMRVAMHEFDFDIGGLTFQSVWVLGIWERWTRILRECVQRHDRVWGPADGPRQLDARHGAIAEQEV